MMTATQVDLFLNQIINAPIKDAQRLMEFPFFSLQKQPRHEPFVYDDGTVRIEITPGSKGIATIYDKDLLIYLASIINERLERGFPVYRMIYFPAYDFLSLTGRGTGKRGYELFYDTLHRLRSTNIVTTIETGGDRERRGFGWIESNLRHAGQEQTVLAARACLWAKARAARPERWSRQPRNWAPVGPVWLNPERDTALKIKDVA